LFIGIILFSVTIDSANELEFEKPPIYNVIAITLANMIFFDIKLKL